ncbi:hypothetical protein SAMN04488023_10794 [Pedobacter rhizosphaerae]|uniref:Uncharacterized protein n=1 Tax=Pedobacter rhizosphaerae TaxID=390241 RepID=A0A1H9N9G5_9SPHI|nr:hypothetical protein SAMN04488023_10794 [Pedobacter rhizosphaerae]
MEASVFDLTKKSSLGIGRIYRDKNTQQSTG